MVEDFERCYRAVQSREQRFDGWFFTAVRTTGIYCRPSCPARTPSAANVTFYPTAAAAAQAGYRACRRCRPDAVPGSPEWNGRSDVVARAMRLIADGAVDRHGVSGLAARLGYSERQLHRLMTAELGTGPLAIARSHRAQSARVLLETTDLALSHVAFSAGFSSVRQFNDSVRAVFGCTPSELRRRRRSGAGHDRPAAAGRITLRLARREPFDAERLLAFLGARALPGVEWAGPDRYARTVALCRGDALLELSPAQGYVRADLLLEDLRDLGSAVNRCRRLLDLDADPEAVDAALGADPLLRRAVESRPGLRIPGAVEPFEIAVRALCGQQVSVATARSVAGRLVRAAGRPIHLGADPRLTHVFPGPADILAAPEQSLPLPALRRRALRSLAEKLAAGELLLDPGAEPSDLRRQLRALPGVGPWTADYIVLRGLSHPDTFLPGDLGVRRAIKQLGVPGARSDLAAWARRWRPWRSYATLHLWSLPGERPGRPPATRPSAKERAA